MSAPGRMLVSLRAAGAALVRARRSLAVGLVLAWMGLVWGLSNREPSGGPTPPVMNWLSNSAHAPLFGLLALWLVLTLPRRAGWPRLDRPRVVFVMLFVLVYAIVDELHQSTVPGRDATGFDVLTDVVGAACTLWIIVYVNRTKATELGLRLRLVLGIAACALAGALAMGL